MSALLAIDPSTQDNGCLEVAVGGSRTDILPHAAGVIDPSYAQANLTFEAVPCEAGDLILFDSYVPHRSSANKTKEWRRAAYITFNKAVEGSHHEEYYKAKAKVFAERGGGSISINHDFDGVIV